MFEFCHKCDPKHKFLVYGGHYINIGLVNMCPYRVKNKEIEGY